MTVTTTDRFRMLGVCLLLGASGSVGCSQGNAGPAGADAGGASSDAAGSGAASSGAAGDAADAGTAGSGGAEHQAGELVDFLDDADYPDDFWQTASLADSDIDAAPLNDALARISTQKLEIHSFLILRRGRLVFERYGWKRGLNVDDTDKSQHQVVPTERHLLHSTTKSITSSLVGIAIDEGLIGGVEDLVLPYFPEFQPVAEPSADKDAMTLEDLLTMRSGLQWQEGVNEEAVFDAPDPAQVMLSRPLVDTPVGTVWNYSSAGSDVIAAILRKVTAQTPLDYADEKLFEPLGIPDVTWLAAPNGTNHGGWGLSLEPRQMARFGELYRNRGVWNGEQVVPAEWTDTATAVRCDTPWNGEYGYHFWIPRIAGFFGTRGAYGQTIYVNRELELVVVFTADLPNNSADRILDDLVRDFVVPAVK
jgi:CubicO group peptidase (beta-lactamase class C family)